MIRTAVPTSKHGLLLLALAAIGWQPAAAQKKVEARGPFLHREAAAVFPVRVGEFRRSDIFRYDEGGRDISASYDLATPEGRLLVTVYIYPAPAAVASERAERCEREFESVKGAIGEHPGGSSPIAEGPALALPGTVEGQRHRAAYRLSITFGGKAQAIRSEAYLYCYVGGDWFVKYRVSAPVAVAAPGAVETFIRTGPWPGRASSETIARIDQGRRGGTPHPTRR